MNKKELISEVSERTNVTKKDVGVILDAITDVISDQMQKKEVVQLIGFGTFTTSERAERTAKNPQTGESIKIKACTMPKFKPGKALKEKLN